MAEKWGVSPRAVYAWLKDPRLADGAPMPKRKRFEPTVEHLTVVAQEQDMQSAHALLEEAGLVDCSYETFARGMRERANPTLVAAALEGYSASQQPGVPVLDSAAPQPHLAPRPHDHGPVGVALP